MKKKMLTSIAGGLALSLTSGAALADGMPSLKDTYVEPAAPTWSGSYFGGSVGYGWNDSKNRYRDSSGQSSSANEDADGGLVSLVWGYDCQWDRIVIGAFVDVDWSDIHRGDTGDGLTIDRAISVGGRLGALVTPNTLAFVTAGYTRAHFDNDGWWDIVNGGTLLPGKSSVNFDGYFIGGGLETRLAGNFFLRGEVRYSKYDSEVTNSGSFAGTDYIDTEDPEIITTRVGLIYKLGGREPWHGTSDGKYKVISYSGIDVAKDIWTLYSGNLFALNGDFTRNGFVFRTFGFYSNYDLDATDALAGPFNVDAKDRSLDVMLGYLYYTGQFSIVGYAGMEIRDIDLSPEALTYDETETGFKVALEIETIDSAPYYFSFDTSYSTAFDTYFGLLRVGWNRNEWKFGPEGEVWSEDGDTTWRLGAFVKLPVKILPNLPTELTVSGGHQWVDDDNNNSGYLAGAHGGEGAYFNSMLKIIF